MERQPTRVRVAAGLTFTAGAMIFAVAGFGFLAFGLNATLLLVGLGLPAWASLTAYLLLRGVPNARKWARAFHIVMVPLLVATTIGTGGFPAALCLVAAALCATSLILLGGGTVPPQAQAAGMAAGVTSRPTPPVLVRVALMTAWTSSAIVLLGGLTFAPEYLFDPNAFSESYFQARDRLLSGLLLGIPAALVASAASRRRLRWRPVGVAHFVVLAVVTAMFGVSFLQKGIEEAWEVLALVLMPLCALLALVAAGLLLVPSVHDWTTAEAPL